MSISNANDTAFPFTPTDRSGQIGESAPGLTKRELFAAMAMQGMCANGIPGNHHIADRLAQEAVRKADALLAELAKDGAA